MGYNHGKLSLHPAALMRISGCEIIFNVLVQHFDFTKCKGEFSCFDQKLKDYHLQETN